LALAAALLSGCTTLQQLGALRHVDFRLDGVSGVRLAGVDLAAVDSYSDLSLRQVASVVQAVSRNSLPLELRLDVTGENPADNPTDARLLELDWTLLLDDRETVSGVVSQPVVLPPGSRRPIPVAVSLDLMTYFDGGARELVDLALAIGGRGEPVEVALRALPTIDTALGPIRYPEPITIARVDVGR
jgi:hypothetical protein